ncbi:MAG: hypothetical protein ACEY3D_06980 [Rickettsia sp.]|uniref:hypothetical protein n=1 Tax=Rickettsia sp. TaxID=789 RepID=UPI00397A4869
MIVGVDFTTNDLIVKSTVIEKFTTSLIYELVKNIQNKVTLDEIKGNIEKNIKHLYYSSIKSKDQHYLSRVLLGQAFTSQDNSNNDAMQISKKVFLYNKDGKLNLISDRVTSIILQQNSQGIILNIIEGSNTHQTRFKSKKQDKIFDDSKILPVENLAIQDLIIINIAVNPKAEIFSGVIGKSYIDNIKVEQKNINQFRDHQKYQGHFQSIATVKVQDLINLIYNLDSSVDSDNYIPLNKKKKVLDKDFQKVLLECVSPIKDFVNQESDLQAIIQGMFINQRLLGGKQIKVFSEVSCGSGRLDLLLYSVDKNFQEDKPILMELKYGSNSALLTEAEKQLSTYSQYLKSATTYKEVQNIAIVYHDNKENNFLQVKISSKKIDHTSQSSDNAQGSSTKVIVNNRVKKVLKISDLTFLSKIKTIDNDIFLDLSYGTNNKMLSDSTFVKIIEFLDKVSVSSSAKITLSLVGNDINEEQATKLFQLLERNVYINSLDISSTNLNKKLLKQLIEALKKKENLIISELLSSADKLWILKDLSIDHSIAQVHHQKTRQLIDEIQAVERLPISEEQRNKLVENILIKEKNKVRFSFLQRLDLSDNQLDIEVAPILKDALGTLDGLEEINLSNNKIGDTGLESIAQGLKQNYAIKILKLSNIGITKIKELSKILSKKMAIIELDLSGNKLSNAEIAVLLDDLTKANAIEKLNLSDNNIQALKSLADFIATSNSLQELNLSNTNLGNQGLELITPALSNSNLNLFLDISGNKISNADILFKSLNPDYCDNVLTGLVLADNEISEVTELSDALIGNKKLQYLDLSNNKITFEAASYIFFSLRPLDNGTPQNDILSTLILSNNPIRIIIDEQDSFNDLKMMLNHNGGLTHLALSNIAIDDSLFQKILDSLQENTYLESIDLSYNKIELIDHKAQERIREFLRENKFLSELNLANNKITDQGGKILISSFLEKEIMNKKIAKRKEFMDLNLSGNPSLGKEFINMLILIIKSEYPIENLRLANNNWSVQDTTKLINAIIANKEKKVNIDLSGNEISLNSQKALNNYRAAINLQILDEDLQNPITTTCLPGTSKGKRSISECKIGWSDVDEISISKTRNSKEIVIDSKKFLAYSKKNIGDEQKSWQLVRLAQEIQNKGGSEIVGEYKGLFDSVIEAGGYKNYLQQERIKEVGLSVINRDEHNISPELKLKLINAAGKVQLISGIHSTIVSCQDENTNSCALSVSGLGYSFLSQPIENMMVKVAPKMVGNAVDVTSKLAPKVLSYDTKFILQTLGVKYGAKIAKGGAGAIASIFDIADIAMASNILIECNKRAASNPCSDKEIRDNIASITFSSVSFISGVGLTAVGAGPAVVVVGAIIMVGQGIYNGISNIIEYEKKYDTTHGENWSIFWRTLLLKRMAEDVVHLKARHDSVNATVQSAWYMLEGHPEEIVAYAIGLGKIELDYAPLCETVIRYFPVFCIGLRPQEGPCKDGGNGLIAHNVTECTIRSQYIPQLHSASSSINMQKQDIKYTKNLSRVLLNSVENATMICLPKITDAIYEKGITSSRSDAVYQCDNAVVMVHNQRQYSQVKDKYIIYDLKYVNAGIIIGSNILNNIFQIFEGSPVIYGGSKILNNRFVILTDKYYGKIYLGVNSTNIIDVSYLQNQHIRMECTYDYPLMIMNIIVDNQNSFKIYSPLTDVAIRYIGREYEVDEIVCKQLFHNGNLIEDNMFKNNSIIIDSGGGENYAKTDKIQNCTKLIMSPNTVVQGASGNYTIYVKSLIDARHNKEKYAFSSINVRQGTIIFTDLSLLKDSNHIVYLEEKNILSFNFSLRDGGTYTLWLENYFNKEDNTNYVLIDKYGSNIVYQHILSNTTIRHFVLYIECRFNTIQEVVEHYRNILPTKEHHDVFGTVKNKLYSHVLNFGSSENDIIIIDKNIVYVEGNNGNDIYLIEDDVFLLQINNQGKDLKLDILKLPINNVSNILLIENTNNLHLLFNNSRDKASDNRYRDVPQEIIIDNYFQDNIYQHMAIMDRNNNSYIAFKESDAKILVPFCHASLDRNIFILSPNSKAVVIGIDVNNIMLYKQGSDLLLTEKKASSFNGLNIILRDYYKDQKQWLAMKLYSYNNGDISNIIDLNNMQMSAISYQEQYDNVIKEYVVDLTNSSYYIHHNHGLYYNGQLVNYPVEVASRNEIIGVVIFKNTPFKRLRVIDHENHIFRNNLYNNESHSLIIENWKTNSKYQISMFEFDTGLNQERISVLNDTIARIQLNNALDMQIKKIDIKVVKAVIDFLKLSCTKYNEQGNLSEELSYHFLEEELSYRIGDSNNQDYSLEEVREYLSSGNDIAGAGLLWLMFKSYNELLIKYPYIRGKDLHKIDSGCFQTVVSYSKTKIMIDNLNDNTSFSRIEHNIKQFINSNKKEVQQVIKQLAELDSINIVDIAENNHHKHHKHRHHHGESTNGAEHHVANKHIRGYNRVRRDIEEELQIAKDRNDNNDGIGVSVGDVAVMSSSSGSSVKPIGYNIIKWIKDNIWASINLNPIERVKNLLNIDDVKEKVEIYDVDVSDNVGYGNNANQQDDLVKKLIRFIEAEIVELEERKIEEAKLLSKLNQKLKIVKEEYICRSDEQEEYEEELSSRLLTLTKRKVDIQKQYAEADQIVIIEENNNEIERIKQSIEENEQLNSNYFREIETVKAKVLLGDITELYYEDRMKDLEQKIKDCEEEDIRLANVLEELEKQQEEYYKLGSILGARLLRKLEVLNIEEKKILQEEEELANMHSNIQDPAQEVYRLKDQIKLQETKIESLKNRLNELNANLATLDTRDSNLSWHEELPYWNETVDAKNDTADQGSRWVNSNINLTNLSNGFIGNNTYQDQVFDYSSLDFQGNLLLLDLLIRTRSGVKYNSQKAMMKSREVDTEYAQSLAYNAYAPYRAENEEDMELLGAS